MTDFLSNDARHIDNEQKATGERGYALDESVGLVGDHLWRWLEFRFVEPQHIARAIDEQTSDTCADANHDHAIVDRASGRLESEPGPQIDDGNELAADLNEAGD